MDISKNDRFMLTKQFDGSFQVGAIYEVANITDLHVVLRDAKTKIAVGAVGIDHFHEYFVKPETFHGWTKWHGLADSFGNMFEMYRTNGRKVQIRTNDGYRSESSCNLAHGDEFNLTFGINLADVRCKAKILQDKKKEYEDALKYILSEQEKNNNKMKKLLQTTNKNTDE